MNKIVENIPYDELVVGQRTELVHTTTEEDVKLFAAASGDTNPAHLDAEYAATTQFKQVIVHGMFSAGLISTAIGTQLPGIGTIYLGQDLQFRRPVYIGDTLTVSISVLEKNDDKKWVTLETLVTNQKGEKVVTGKANVMPPTQKVQRTLPDIPQVKFVD
ncbi:MAG: MaoC family dehydratase N-terminal domain-containing protein [Neisseriaceae bacterium]|nr:MaoC family dehydratase N-terminal domain-containing protein [Neisseriaceae bacterium]